MPDPIPLLDLKAQYRSIAAEIDQALAAVLREQRFILGPEVEALEREIAARVGASQAIGVSSGSDALLVALQSLGVGPGDEVITSAFSFFASAGSIARLGATPVLADIQPGSYNLDPDAVAARVSRRTRAVVPVHLFGRCAPVEAIAAAAPGIPVVEDAAQALDAARHGTPAGALGRAACLSFFPSKNLGGYGDGGMVTTSDEELAARVRGLRVHGQLGGGRYLHQEVGGNFRLDALQAAVLRVKLRHLQSWTEARRQRAARYRELLGALPRERLVLPPGEEPGCVDVYNQFVIRAPGRRDALAAHLRDQGIGCAIYYPRGLHQQPCFAALDHGPDDFPCTEAACREVLALPVYPELTDAQQVRVARVVTDFLSG